MADTILLVHCQIGLAVGGYLILAGVALKEVCNILLEKYVLHLLSLFLIISSVTDIHIDKNPKRVYKISLHYSKCLYINVQWKRTLLQTLE